MFLLNSRLGRFSATRFRSPPHGWITYNRLPFSRSYGDILPSSFSTDHSSTLGFSPRLPVSVYGTVGPHTPARGFSRRPASESLGGARRPLRHRLSRIKRSFTPAPRYRLASGRPSPDGSSASASPLAVRRIRTGTGIFTRFPSPTPLGLGLGAGLPGADDPGSGTLRLSVWGILPPIIAYSFRHLHFPPLHRPSQDGFHAMGTLPYHET